ncbi:MAG: hypothetical protein ACI9KN_001233 [Gammaproteobacteria bacterium]|jgi:hypothetical protein
MSVEMSLRIQTILKYFRHNLLHQYYHHIVSE